ncbi:MAG: hypothetical protein PWP28_1253 [Oceanotoga sp.]|uniref:hypothetical protein n=1 Tax=Oceanotoga sp. TaxID=2108366 RepID=UPI0026521D47|nr:hypothetical protein [Oceanotoga sp.]MDN5342378.1 hypothetical protein [Oceanotoga sp.]
MISGIISILIGGIILLGIVFKLTISFNVIIELIIGISLIVSGMRIFKKIKGEYIGSLLFGLILVMDAFKLFPEKLKFWPIVLLMIASYFIGYGLANILSSGKFLFKSKKHHEIEKNIMEFSDNNINELKKISFDVDWTKFNLNSNNQEQLFKLKSEINKDIFRSNMDFKEDESALKLKNKLKVSNIKIPEKAFMNLKIKKQKEYEIKSNVSVSEIFFDLRDIYLKNMKLKSTASKIIIIPSEFTDSIIDLDLEITSLTVKLPKKVGLVLNHIGELNLKNFEGLFQRDDGSYISSNYSDANQIVYLNISSEMSRLGVQII